MKFYLRSRAESRRFKQRLTNRAFLGFFLALCVLVVTLKIVDGILLDLGYRNGTINLSYWSPSNVARWLDSAGSEGRAEALSAVARHPNSIWFLTQFTYLTTIVIIIYLTIRFFELNDIVPKWLRWVMTQRTLTLVTIYDLIVGIVFWAGLSGNFANMFNPDLRDFEIFITVLVHAVIPVLITTYATIFLVRDPQASLLKNRFVGRAMLFPVSYALFYILLTIVWEDPYQVTTMHRQLVANDRDSWNNWASELWKFPLALGAIYILIGIFSTTHNFVLIRFNKGYDFSTDVEMHQRRAARVARIEKMAARDFKRK